MPSAIPVLFSGAFLRHFRGMADEHRYDQANKATRDWATATKKKLALRVGTLTLKDKRALQKFLSHKRRNPEYKHLAPSIGYNFRRDFGQISRINFVFSRQGIFLERGAGKGRKGKAAKPWIEPVLSPSIDALADLLVEHFADVVDGEIKFTIPGIISRRVKLSGGANP